MFWENMSILFSHNLNAKQSEGTLTQFSELVSGFSNCLLTNIAVTVPFHNNQFEWNLKDMDFFGEMQVSHITANVLGKTTTRCTNGTITHAFTQLHTHIYNIRYLNKHTRISKYGLIGRIQRTFIWNEIRFVVMNAT